MQKIILSERQKPRSLQLMKDIYAAHLADPKCELGEGCPMLLNLKAQIAQLENEGPALKVRSAGVQQ